MGTLAELKHEPEPDITPIPLMQLATAFWGFKTLSTAIDMDLFTRLEASPMNPPELARWLNIEERPAEMILTGCAGLGLLSKQNGRYRNTPLAETFLVRGGRYYFGGFVTMLNHRLYSGWDKLPQAMRTNRPTTWDPDKQKSLFEAADPDNDGDVLASDAFAFHLYRSRTRGRRRFQPLPKTSRRWRRIRGVRY